MARPRSFQCEGLVLKSVPMGEAGLLVTLYTKEAGKLRVVVRGARKPTSKLVGHLEPLNLVHLSLASSKPGGIDTVTQAQMIESHASLKGDLHDISRSIYLMELADGFGAEGSPNQELYCLLLNTLSALRDNSEPELTLRYFELHLLKCTGFMPELYHCVNCRRDLAPGRHRYSPDLGGALCPECTPAGPRIMHLSLQALKVLRFMDRTSLSEPSQLRISSDLQEELKEILSATLKYWLDREIRSKRFLEHLEHSAGLGVYSRGA